MSIRCKGATNSHTVRAYSGFQAWTELKAFRKQLKAQKKALEHLTISLWVQRKDDGDLFVRCNYLTLNRQ